MIKNKDEIVRSFCKDIFLESEKYIADKNIINKDKNKSIEFYNNGVRTLLSVEGIKIDRFFKIDNYFMFFNECEVLEDCMCPKHIEYDAKTGHKNIYYGLPESFISYLAGYSIEDTYTLFIRNNLYMVAEIYYSNRYEETGEESPIRYEGATFTLENGTCTTYCPVVTGINMCYGDIVEIDSCLECEYANKDFVSQQEGESLVLIKEEWESKKGCYNFEELF